MNSPCGMPPFSYQEYNTCNGLVTPSTTHVSGTGLSLFFQRYFLQRMQSVLKWELPDSWSKNYFLNVLYVWGWIGVVNTDKFGTICQGCGLRGYDIYYQPTHAVISNPLLTGILEPRIGQNCELIRLTPDYRGVYDIISYYGDQMALAAQALAMNLVNSKMAHVFFTGSKNGAETMKKMFDKIMAGNPAVVVDKDMTSVDGTPNWQLFVQNLSQNHISPQLLEEMRYIQNMFDTEIGIPNANTSKRERLITDEVQANNVETLSKTALWLEYLKESVDKVNKMFDLSISVDWRFPQEEVLQDGSVDFPAGSDAGASGRAGRPGTSGGDRPGNSG